MEQDFSKILTFEIKKELADRYFGFRKMIEEDIHALNEEVKRHESSVEQNICHDLVRIYILLQDESYIDEFFQLSGLEEDLFFDSYLLESLTLRKKLFEGIKTKGLTRAGKFKNLLLTCYENLEQDISSYREKFSKMIEEQEIIKEEIRLFYQKHDISTIMDFLRRVDNPVDTHSMMDKGVAFGASAQLADKMRVEPPIPIESILSFIPPITPLPRIKWKLKRLADRAYALHGKEFLVF